ncbi:hypothetical protein GCK32_016745 [Trichostrongylus colubriformis]|uniref:Uncharacterized protein n=1 Tax=Trichostrongylus colubriformis TaxID=6319 RepID=A0AAN8FJB3_TRICO
MTESDIDKEVEKMLSLDDDEDSRVAILQSQVSVLIEQVWKLSQHAVQSEQPMELDKLVTATALNFRDAMQRVREGDVIPPVELAPFNPADAEQAIGLQTGAAHDHTTDTEQPRPSQTKQEPSSDNAAPAKPQPSSKEKWDEVPNVYHYTRVDIGPPQEDPLHLFHPCTCNIFRTKAQTALPSLRSDLARSKPVNNMFGLANVASSVLDPFWGDRRKEEELLAKDSKHLTVSGLAHATAAHRSSCYAYSSALRNARGKHIDHPPLFSAFPRYHIKSYYNQVIERLDQIPKEYDDSPANPTIVALPLSFL